MMPWALVFAADMAAGEEPEWVKEEKRREMKDAMVAVLRCSRGEVCSYRVQLDL